MWSNVVRAFLLRLVTYSRQHEEEKSKTSKEIFFNPGDVGCSRRSKPLEEYAMKKLFSLNSILSEIPRSCSTTIEFLNQKKWYK